MACTAVRNSASVRAPAQNRRERALILATRPKLVTRALIRRLWVMLPPSGKRTVATMLDVIVKTSTRSKPHTCSSRWMVSSTRLTSAPYVSSSSPASRAQVKHSVDRALFCALIAYIACLCPLSISYRICLAETAVIGEVSPLPDVSGPCRFRWNLPCHLRCYYHTHDGYSCQ